MQWLPDTVDAFGRLSAQTGAIGLIAFTGVVGLLLILWRHLGQMIPLATAYVESDRKASLRVIDELSQIKQTNAQIVETNLKIAERVAKLPSDIPVCRAKTAEEIIVILNNSMLGKGMNFTEAEVAAALRERAARKARETDEMPALKK